MRSLTWQKLALRWVIFGGEALGVAASGRLGTSAMRTMHPALINMYGITETTVHVTYLTVDEVG